MRHVRPSLLILLAATLTWLAIGQTESRAEENKTPRRLLFFTRSVGFQHSVVQVKDGKPCYAETILKPICKEHGWELITTKDGRLFTPENLAKFDALLFYTQGDLEAESRLDHSPPMTKEGKQALLDAVKGGKGFVGFHCASDTFHSPGPQWEAQPASQRDPYIDMVGGEFIVHQSQQETTMKVADPKFPGAGSLGDGFKMLEEWYSLKNFADDLHVLLVNETEGMHDKCYERPPYPATWIHNYGKGRVFYTSMGHREDVWTRPEFQSIVIGGITWAVGDAKADTTPNIKQVTPQANVMPTR
jgi:hypothetical protein